MEVDTVVAALGFMIVVLAAVIGSLLLVVVLYISHGRKKYSHLPSPPYDSFFFGHVPELRKFKLEGNYIGVLFRKWAEECGPVFVLYLVHKQLVFITGAASLKEILTKSKYPKAKAVYLPLFSLFGCRFLGTGLLSQTDHTAWRRRHVVVNPAFHKKYLMGFMEQFNSVGDRWVQSLKTVADGKTTIKMHEYLFRVTSDAISEVGFQDRRNLIESKDDRFLDAIKNCLHALSITTRDPLSDYRPSQSKYRQTVRDSVNLVRTYGQNVLNARIDQMRRGQPVPEDILSYIIKCKDLDPSLTDEDLLDDFVTLFIAGQETTSNALSFMFCEVGKKPDVLQKLQDEIDAVMGSRTDVEYEDISKLEYCGQVFKEVLRLYPVAPGTSRETAEEVSLDGYRLPAGTCFAVPSYVIHRMHSYYDNPDEFCPERFGSEQRTLFTYMPFSLGQRSCIGQQFAKIEAKVLMCKFFQNFHFNLDMNQSFHIEEVSTLRPKDGAIMTLSHRR